MTEAQAGPSLSSVVMSLKRIPSVGKSLMSRIFARSSLTSMAAGMLPVGLGGRNPKNLVRKRGEVGNHQVGRGGRSAEPGGVVRGAHADPLRSDHVGIRIVADVHRFTGRHPGALQRDVEDPSLRLA